MKSAGVKRCAELCKNFKYFGLECPGKLDGEADTDGPMVHCQCTDTLADSHALSADQCNQKNVNHGTHCSGPYMADQYMLGSHGTGSVYLTSPEPSGVYTSTKAAAEGDGHLAVNATLSGEQPAESLPSTKDMTASPDTLLKRLENPVDTVDIDKVIRC